jgi:integrase
VRELPDQLKPVLMFAYFTGCRKGEITALRWSQVDLMQQIIRLNPGETKSGEGRMIPLVPELVEALVIQKATRDQYWPRCAFVFHRFGEQLGDFRDGWSRACKRAQLWDTEKGAPSLLFHELRCGIWCARGCQRRSPCASAATRPGAFSTDTISAMNAI